MRATTTCWRFLLAAVALPLSASYATAKTVAATSLSYGPLGVIAFRSPEIAWRVVGGDEAEVVSTRMTVNGAPVAATYDPENHSLTYSPEQLPAGAYKVAARVTFRGGESFDRAWSFRVAQNAAPSLPDASLRQIQALNAVNAVRDALRLPRVVMDARLNAAADAHSRYLEANLAYGHVEQPGKPAFVGATAEDRLSAFGWNHGYYEDVSTGLDSARQCVAGLFDAPYHRIPFMQPGRFAVGSGLRGDSFTLEFAESGAAGAVVSPTSGQSGVPTSWDGNESPSPLRTSGIKGPTGYPIVFAYFSPGLNWIRLVSVRLTSEYAEVPFVVNAPSNDDHLTNAFVIIPKKPLAPNAAYTVSVRATTDGGLAVDRRWTFRTR